MGAHRSYRDQKFVFGKQILTLRTRAALTQRVLAEQLGVHLRSVQNWETGESYPKADALQRLIAVFLAHATFTTGNERAEAEALWKLAAEDGPHALAAFDEPWFAHTLALQASGVESQGLGIKDDESPQSLSTAPRSLIDWGEAIAVSALYGRESELQTLHQWIVADHCRVVTIVGLGGMGKSSLALTFAHQVVSSFDVVLFRTFQNGPALSEVLDQMIRAVSDQQVTSPMLLPDKITLLIQRLRERRCLLVLDNLESIMQPGALIGTYRTGYAEYGALLRALSEREHQSCLLLTSREKPAELGPLEGRAAPVRALHLASLDDSACRSILQAKDIAVTPAEASALAHFYGGNPLALMLVAEPIRELFGGNVGGFLAAGDTFFNAVGTLLDQQFARLTLLERTILYQLAIEREPVSLNGLLANLGDTVPQRAFLVALESLGRRVFIERSRDRPAFTLQPVIQEYVTDQLVAAICQELVDGQPALLHRHPIIQATTRDEVRRSQERLIATPLIERLGGSYENANAVERQLLALLASWRDQPPAEVGYGPGNVINLLRLMRGHLRGLDLAGLVIRQAYLQGVDLQDTSLAGAMIQDSRFTEAFGIIHAVAASPDSSYWAASSTNGTIRVWHDDGKTIYLAILAHAKQVTSLAFSPNGQTLASGSYDCTIKLWDMTNGALIRTLEGHSDYVQSIAFAPDGRRLVSGSDDRTIRLWDVSTGACFQILDAHTDNVYGVVWSSDGRLMASCSFDLTLRVWDVASGVCVQILEGHTRPISKLAFSPDGRLLASGGFDWAVKLWDVASGQCLQTFEEHTSTVKAIAWSPDGRRIASASYDATIRLWERDTAQHVLLGHAASVNSIAFTAEGSRLISGSDDHTVRIWNVASGWCERVIQGYGLFFFAVLWSPDGQRLLSANSNATLTVWNVVDGMALQILYGHTHTVYTAAWSLDGRWLASGGYDQTIRIWDAATSVCVRVIQAHDDIVYQTVWSPDGRWLASASRDQTVRIWNTATGACRWVSNEHTGPINEVAWSPDGHRLASCSEDRTVRLWRAEDGMLLQTLVGHTRSVPSVAWSLDGRQLASCGGGGAIGELFLWDAESGKLVRTFIGHTSNVFRISWSMDGKMLLSGGMNGTIRWWDVASGTALYTRQAHQGWIHSLSRSPDGATLVSSGEDGIIQLWDIQRAELLRTVRIDRPYERLIITEVSGLTEAQRSSLLALGALEQLDARRGTASTTDRPIVILAQPAREQLQTGGGQDSVSFLPFQATSFVGRDAELTAISKILGDPACRLLTLLGPGGIGKTRLALAVAASHNAAFRDGVAFVALASVETPNQIVSAIGEALSLSFAGQPDPTAYLLGELSKRHLLLILDNFEHLLAMVDLVATMLAQASQITIMVTSRTRLHLQSEWLFDVAGLNYPPDHPQDSATSQSLTALTDYSAVQLFIQRATQIQPGLLLSETSVAAIIRICHHVAGMPLAIELAAASVRTLPITEIERQIRANLDVLATTLRDVPARHRSMRAVFDHSWRVLSEPERVLLSSVAVFRGGWTAEAAEHITGATLPNLMALVDMSLVRQSNIPAWPSAERVIPGAAAELRFVLLEPIREYALEQLLARNEAMALQRAHASYYLALATEAAAQWYTASVDLWIEKLHRESDNMRAALQWARDSGNHVLGLQLAGALWKFWQGYGYTSEGRAWLDQLLTLHDPHPDPTTMVARLSGLQAAAWLASDQHDDAQAMRLLEQRMLLRRALREKTGETNPLVNAARQARTEGQYQRATAALEDALSRHNALRAQIRHGSAELGLAFDDLGQVLRVLGLVYREQGEFAQARTLFEESLTMQRRFGDREGAAFSLIGLADVARDQGDAARVREYAGESLTILRELRIQWMIGFALNTLAQAAYIDGDLTLASALIEESVTLFRGLNAYSSLAEILVTQGNILHARGDAVAAYSALSEALRFAWAVGPRLFVAAALEGLASIDIGRGEASRTVQLLAAASRLRVQMGTPVRPIEQAAVEQALATARSILGGDVCATLWAQVQAQAPEHILSILPSVAAFDIPRID